MFFILFSIEFVANHAHLVALNLLRITHFSCKFLGPKKSACVNVLTYSTSGKGDRKGDGKQERDRETVNENGKGTGKVKGDSFSFCFSPCRLDA